MSEYFEAALRWEEKKIDFKDCSAEDMSVTVNFMYGFSISGDFKENGGGKYPKICPAPKMTPKKAHPQKRSPPNKMAQPRVCH